MSLVDKELFENDPRDYAISLVEESLINTEDLARALLSYLSHDDVRGALEANFLDPDNFNDFFTENNVEEVRGEMLKYAEE